MESDTQGREGSRGYITYPCEECQKRHVAVAIAGSSHSNGGDDDQHQLDTIEPGPPISVSEIAEQQLADDGAGEGGVC